MLPSDNRGRQFANAFFALLVVGFLVWFAVSARGGFSGGKTALERLDRK